MLPRLQNLTTPNNLTTLPRERFSRNFMIEELLKKPTNYLPAKPSDEKRLENLRSTTKYDYMKTSESLKPSFSSKQYCFHASKIESPFSETPSVL